jgi:hypothetical protein
LDFEYPQYEEARRNDQYLLGDNVLVAPITYAFSDTFEIVPTEWLTASDGSNGLDATYYLDQGGKHLSGSPRAQRVEPNVNFDWGDRNPDGVTRDTFSVRWEGTLTNHSDMCIGFAATADDGIRVKINGETIIDTWGGSSAVVTVNKSFLLDPGESCELVVEYYELTGNAKALLYYFSAPADGSEYKDTREVFIPDGTWMDVWTGKTYTGPQTITAAHDSYTSPVFVKLGSFTVLAANEKNLSTSDWDSLAVDVYPGAGRFDYELYEDDGVTEDYMNDTCRRTQLSMNTEGKVSTLKIGNAAGDYQTEFTERTYAIRVHEVDGYKVSGITVNGESVEFTRVAQADAYTEGGLPFAFEGASCDTDVVTITFTANLKDQSEIVINYN